MDAAELLWQRDVARARLVPLEAENSRLKTLLRYAEDAIAGEYQRAESLRSSASRKV